MGGDLLLNSYHIMSTFYISVTDSLQVQLFFVFFNCVIMKKIIKEFNCLGFPSGVLLVVSGKHFEAPLDPYFSP